MNKNNRAFVDNISVTVNGKTKNFGTDFNSALNYFSQCSYEKLNKYKKNTKQGYVVKNNFGKGRKQYSVIERPKGTFTSPDYIVANCYDKRTGTWAQGYYDFPTREKAVNFAKKNAYRR